MTVANDFLKELADKAIRQARDGYPFRQPDEPVDMRVMIDTSRRALEELTDFPADKKNTLVAALGLILSRDVAVDNSMPDNIGQFGASVSSIVAKYLDNDAENSFMASDDLKHIGLAAAMGTESFIPRIRRKLLDSVENLPEGEGEDERNSLRMQLKDMSGVLETIAGFKTGQSPRLEARADQFAKAMKEMTDALAAEDPWIVTEKDKLARIKEAARLSKPLAAPKPARFTKRTP